MNTVQTTGITARGQKMRQHRENLFFMLLFILWCALSGFLLIYGNQVYSVGTVIRVLLGEQIKGATYAVMTIRVPRVLVGTLAGFAFGIAGNTFQKILRNSLASPDVMGITSGASAAAVFAMMVLNLSGLAVSAIALFGGMLAAGAILLISRQRVFSVNKMILTGIGIQAMLQAVINYIILKTSDYNIADALRWLSGSLNGARMSDVSLFGVIVVVCVAVICALDREIQILALGEELPITLGMNTGKARMLLIFSAVFLCAGTTAVTGPLSSVAFMSGPIAARMLKTGSTGTLHAGVIGAVLVLFSEAIGQFAFATRYPVGVITGIIGAPYLLYLLIRMNSKNA
ncbi:MAG: iron ABC transporter permease [Clostridia bacterium]|nr:iron ABC transporter permease [Clostridia bacterium]